MSAKTHTTNGAVALETSGSKFVDAFTMIVRGLDNELINKYLSDCWEEDPKKTVALIFHSRDRQDGKKEKNVSNRAMIWLKKNKYGTYVKNIHKYVSKYGCWKDMVYICIKTSNNDYEIESIASQLKTDKKLLEEHKQHDISLCAKWAPTERDKNDVKFNTAHKIAAKLFENDDKMMTRYRKEYLAPLRKNIDIVESYMVANRWKEIKYERVPAIASKRLKNAFNRHDPDGYNAYLQKVANGTRKINVTGILPHELVNYYVRNNGYDETIEQQWKALLQNIKSQGILKNMLAIVDVSGSMYDGGDVQPIQPAIALGLLIAECNQGAFHKKVISFHSTPEFFEIKGESLYEQVNHIKNNLSTGLSTNFEATFDLLLNAAKMFNATPDQMPESVIVLSDMQFNQASKTNLDELTMHEYIMQKYENSAYKPPKLIYWNLSPTFDNTFPVKAVSENVAMISGFSEQLLKVFMNSADIGNPENIVNEILSKYVIEVVIHENDA